MWIARDKNGSLNLFEHKPNRRANNTMIGYEKQLEKCIWKSTDLDKHAIYQIAPICYELNKICENLTWEDEPIEISIVYTDYLKDLEKIMDMYEEKHCSIDT